MQAEGVQLLSLYRFLMVGTEGWLLDQQNEAHQQQHFKHGHALHTT
jgi:hypothetical protein